jgi:hypothetical protein
MGERTGSLVLCSLWRYVKAYVVYTNIYSEVYRNIGSDTPLPEAIMTRLRSP